jgi:hypothetical protein
MHVIAVHNITDPEAFRGRGWTGDREDPGKHDAPQHVPERGRLSGGLCLGGRLGRGRPVVRWQRDRRPQPRRVADAQAIGLPHATAASA